MKKKAKKLVLAKETVRELDTIAHVAGGVTLSGRFTCDCVSRAAACPGSLCGDTCSC